MFWRFYLVNDALDQIWRKFLKKYIGKHWKCKPTRSIYNKPRGNIMFSYLQTEINSQKHIFILFIVHAIMSSIVIIFKSVPQCNPLALAKLSRWCIKHQCDGRSGATYDSRGRSSKKRKINAKIKIATTNCSNNNNKNNKYYACWQQFFKSQKTTATTTATGTHSRTRTRSNMVIITR